MNPGLWGYGNYEWVEEYDGFEEDYGERAATLMRIKVGIARVPVTILQSTATGIHESFMEMTIRQRLPRAWMVAIAENSPQTPLAKIRTTDPSLLPDWLLPLFPDYHVRINKFICLEMFVSNDRVFGGLTQVD